MYNINDIVQKNYTSWEDISMTQLVSAICDQGKTVVTVSDRMISTGDMTMAWEQPRPKYNAISNKAVVLSAGTVHEPDILRRAEKKSMGREDILEIADAIKAEYQKARQQTVIDMILIPKLGIYSIDEWHQKQANLHFKIVEDIQNAIEHVRVHSHLVLAGVDNEGHLIEISDPGIISCWDTVSFSCVGIGERHASNVFAWYKYSRNFPLNSAIFIAFEAKKRAELAGGVGKSTDVLIINSDGVNKITDETIQVLEDIYNARESEAIQTGFDKRISNLDIKTEELSNKAE
jgi:hypothetical protein